MVCTKCKIDKRETDFNFTDKTYTHRRTCCKRCKNQIYQRKWYDSHRSEHNARATLKRIRYKTEIRKYLIEFYKTHPCEKCGFSNPAALEFHHKDPKTKKKNVANLAAGSYPLRHVVEEIAKCQVLCSNCHRILTAKKYNWFRFQ